MWFKFPNETTMISVEQQRFGVEYENAQGRYFRAPEHFARRILEVSGFEKVDPPEGAPEDLSAMFSIAAHEGSEVQDSRIRDLSAEVQNLRTDNSALRAELAATLHERDQLKLELHEAQVKISDLEEQLEDEGKS